MRQKDAQRHEASGVLAVSLDAKKEERRDHSLFQADLSESSFKSSHTKRRRDDSLTPLQRKASQANPPGGTHGSRHNLQASYGFAPSINPFSPSMWCKYSYV